MGSEGADQDRRDRAHDGRRRADRQGHDAAASRCGSTRTASMIAGRKVEVIVEDSQGQPNVALTKLQKLVESDKVQVLVGEVFAHIGYAMAPKVDEYRIPMLYPGHRRRRSHPAQAGEVGGAHGLDLEPAEPSLRRVRGEDAGLQTHRDRGHRLCLRLGAGRRLPEDLRGKRRPDRPEALGPAQHRRLRAVPRPRSGATPTPSSR